MAAYAFRRLLAGAPTILGVTLLTFLLFHVAGGNPVVAFLGKSATPAEIAALEHAYGFDLPLPQQYLRYLGELARLDFGRSFATREPVLELLSKGAGPSLSITLPALLLGTLLAIGLGLWSARRRGRASDRLLLLATVVGMSVSFLLYIVAGQYLLAFHWPLFPIHGYAPGLLDRWPYLALPIGILIAVGLGYDVRYFRAVLGQELGRDHVLVARARGLPEGVVLGRHVLRNALIPILARVMMAVPFLLTGSLLLESFFGIPGLGHTLLDAVEAADLPVLKAYTWFLSLLLVGTNLLTDLLYAALDPRVRLR